MSSAAGIGCPLADTPPTGGTAIAEDGTVYLSDTDNQRIVRIAPDEGTSKARYPIAKAKPEFRIGSTFPGASAVSRRKVRPSKRTF